MRPRTPFRRRTRLSSRGAFTTLVAALCLAAGCSPASSPGDTIDADVARAEATWKMRLDGQGAGAVLPLEAMDIHLVDDDQQWPENFEISGPQVTLVGQFPMDVHVGHESAFDRLIGRTVTIDRHGGDPLDPKNSSVRLGGSDLPILSGTVTFDRLTGKWDGQDGDRTLWGRVVLRVPGAGGDRTLRGSFAVHAITWG